MKPRILAISPTDMEFVQRTETFPEAGQTVVGNSYDYIPGGEGAELAVTLKMLGAECILCSRVGADSNGQRLRTQFREMGIDTRFMCMDRRAATGLVSVITDASGASRRVSFPGANLLLSATDAEDAFTAIPDAAIISMRSPERVVTSVSEYAARKKIPLMVDGGPIREAFPLSKLFPCEIFIPDEGELLAYTGIAPSNTENCLRSVIRLSSIVKAKFYIIKMGGRGAFLYDGKYYNVVLPNNVDDVDTSCAGSVFDAALLAEYMRSSDIMRSVHYANAAAALTVSRHGSLDSIPTEEELSAFIEERGIKL